MTGADLNYVGSISLDPALMELADILEWEKVAVLDIDNGARFETYAIVGGPGEVTLNGAAARLVHPGDRVIVITYADYEDAELEGFTPTHRPRRRPQPAGARPELPGDTETLSDRPDGPFDLFRAHLIIDVLVLGSGVAGLTAALDRRRGRAGGHRPDQGRAGGLGHPLRPGRRGGGPVAQRLSRAALLRHALGRRRAVRPRSGAGARRRGPGPAPGADGPRRLLRPDGDGGAGAPLAMAREGGHSLARVVHAGGDATGHEVERALVAATVGHPGVTVHEGWLALALHLEGGRVAGVVGLPSRTRSRPW